MDLKMDSADSFAPLFPSASSSKKVDSRKRRADSKPNVAVDASAFQSLLEALSSEKNEPEEQEADELFMKQFELDFRKLAVDKRDYAKIKIMTFLYELKLGPSENAQLSHSSSSCPCVSQFVAKVQQQSAAKEDDLQNNHFH
jgi:hypothetical protein